MTRTPASRRTVTMVVTMTVPRNENSQTVRDRLRNVMRHHGHSIRVNPAPNDVLKFARMGRQAWG